MDMVLFLCSILFKGSKVPTGHSGFRRSAISMVCRTTRVVQAFNACHTYHFFSIWKDKVSLNISFVLLLSSFSFKICLGVPRKTSSGFYFSTIITNIGRKIVSTVCSQILVRVDGFASENLFCQCFEVHPNMPFLLSHP